MEGSAKRICVVTGSRAEFGLLYWVMKALKESPVFDLKVAATGMHLSTEFGLTYQDIVASGFTIDKKVEVLLSSDSPVGVSKAIGLGVISFSEVFAELNPDIILLLGDRFEILAAAIAGMVARIPLAHCHGGETTEGLIDEAVRHSITKMSHIHFAATEAFRQRIIQLGEPPETVITTGALGTESIRKLALLDKEAFQEAIGFRLDGAVNFLVTFHPVTLELATSAVQFRALLDALEEVPDSRILFSKANADMDGRIINEMIDDYVATHRNAKAVTSLGQLRYLSAMRLVDMVVGNSSSGLIETPSFRKPTINIGDRQKGRLKAASVIDCTPDKDDIGRAIREALSKPFQENLRGMANPYDHGNASETILTVLEQTDFRTLLKKRFHDIA